MIILFLSFIAIPILVVLELAAQRWLFKDSDKVCNQEWELYAQRYD